MAPVDVVISALEEPSAVTPLGSPGNLGLRGILSQDLPLSVVCSSTCVEIKFYGAFVLNRRVDLHAIDGRLLDGVAVWVSHPSTEPARPRRRREMT